MVNFVQFFNLDYCLAPFIENFNLVNLDFLFFQDYVHFHVTNPMTPWDYLFSTMEETKQKFPELSDYSVSETTLEQVFLSFAKKQRKNFKDQ